MTITFQMFAWAIGLFFAWNGLLLSAIRWLISREVSRFETKLSEADGKAATALDSVAKAKQIAADEMAAIRLEFAHKVTCNNHQRMEENDKNISKRLDELHGDIRELCGGVKALTNSMDLVNQHLISGGK